MPRFSIGRRLSRRWTLLVAIVVVAVAGFAQPQRADAVTLPCAYDTTTTQPPVNTQNAYTYCLDKSG